MAGQVVGEDELLDLTNKGYPKDASEGEKIITVYVQIFEGCNFRCFRG